MSLTSLFPYPRTCCHYKFTQRLLEECKWSVLVPRSHRLIPLQFRHTIDQFSTFPLLLPPLFTPQPQRPAMANVANNAIGYVIDGPLTEKEALEWRWTQEKLRSALKMLSKQRVYIMTKEHTHSTQEKLDTVEARLQVWLLTSKAISTVSWHHFRRLCASSLVCQMQRRWKIPFSVSCWCRLVGKSMRFLH